MDVVVAGHICLDIFPQFNATAAGPLLVPGKLVDIGPATFSTGGAVANTGVALHRLGVPALLMGKVGDDHFGKIILDILRQSVPETALAMRVSAAPLPQPLSPQGRGESTSYTIVINAAGMDRCFLHCPGANDTFCVDDIDGAKLSGAKLFHFGYPPLMRRMYADGGVELSKVLQCAKDAGLTTSLDMALPDPASPAGAADWEAILKRALPVTDVFLPSLDELLYMLERTVQSPKSKVKSQKYGASTLDFGLWTLDSLSRLAGHALDLGAAIVAIKLGDQGLFVRTTADKQRLARMGRCAPPESWLDRSLLVPCFEVEVAGTTGSGDCTIAGFLLGLLRGWSLEETMTMAVAVGACSVERADATSGVRPCAEVQQRIAGGWKKRP